MAATQPSQRRLSFGAPARLSLMGVTTGEAQFLCSLVDWLRTSRVREFLDERLADGRSGGDVATIVEDALQRSSVGGALSAGELTMPEKRIIVQSSAKFMGRPLRRGRVGQLLLLAEDWPSVLQALRIFAFSQCELDSELNGIDWRGDIGSLSEGDIARVREVPRSWLDRTNWADCLALAESPPPHPPFVEELPVCQNEPLVKSAAKR
jgi:hypothetical protein